MVQSKITYYAVMTPERRYEKVVRAARIAGGLSPDSSEPEEEEQPGEEGEDEEMTPMEVEDAEAAEEPDQQVPAYNMEQAEAKFAIVQSDEMADDPQVQGIYHSPFNK